MRTAAAEVTLAQATARLRRWVDAAGADPDTFALIAARSGDEPPNWIHDNDEVVGVVTVLRRRVGHTVDEFIPRCDE